MDSRHQLHAFVESSLSGTLGMKNTISARNELSKFIKDTFFALNLMKLKFKMVLINIS